MLKHHNPASFSKNGVKISNPVDIANDFCDYFTNIVSNLSSKFSPTNSSSNNFLCRSLSESISLQPLTFNIFSNIVKSFSINKAPGHDNISMKIIHKSLQPEIRPNFSDCHTFSLTATAKIVRFALPAGMLLQSETKIEPDLRLQSLKNIVQPLVYIIILLLSTGVFPESLKIAKVIPFFKADDPTLFSNYRPMSILRAFSKLFEKVMFNRLTELH